MQLIDPDTRKVTRTIKTGRGPRFFDVGEGAAWTLDQVDGTVTRIDADTGRTAASRPGFPAKAAISRSGAAPSGPAGQTSS